MRRSAISRILAFLVVGCSDEAEEAQAASEASPGPPAPRSAAVVRDSSVGCVELGASLESVISACGEVTDTALRLEGSQQPAVWVKVEGGRALAEMVSGSVWRIRVTDPELRTADSLGAGTPVNRLADHPGVRIAHGEGVFARTDDHCGKSFGLTGLPYRRGGWSAAQLAELPDSVAVVEVLVVGRCDHR